MTRVEQIRALAVQGLTRAQIGAEVGIPGPRVGKIALQNGIFIAMADGRRGDGISIFAKVGPKQGTQP